ncbi:MAG: DUF401 family protein [Candidatus Asgardarchaeia archaeon]
MDGGIYTMFAFVISLALILYLSKRNIALAIFVGSIALGALTSSPEFILEEMWDTFIDSENIALSLATGFMPIIGELLNSTGMLNHLIKKFRRRKREFLIFSPALLGLLPMPGGALFSAPMVERSVEGLDGVKKASINVWFRHVMHLIYPLVPALIVACELAGQHIYQTILFLSPFFIIALLFGTLYLIDGLGSAHEIDSEEIYVDDKEFLKPLVVIIVAPILDFTLKTFYGMKSFATLIAVSLSLFLALIFGKVSHTHLVKSVRRAKPWNFIFMIMAIYFYQGVFKVSGVPQMIESFEIPLILFLIVPGFILGILTGRVSTPLIILIPIYLTKFGLISPLNLAALYYFTLLGYLISPVHPCVTVTAEYFNIEVKDLIKGLIKTDLISLFLGLLFFLIATPLLGA